ncbi:Chromatin structure remodeling complex protein sfh1 [Sporothrix bragantina]|uniref:Chromatin structure remodeling complex protein sfh1 n=1 Tax=Sporothrix bragantina TaxID=671064 RepID=A0ABP0B266_9PEZI
MATASAPVQAAAAAAPTSNSSAASSAPQAYWSSYAARLRAYHNALLVPVNPSAPIAPKTTKRGTTIINYAEDGYDDYLDDDDDNDRRRPSSLRLRGTPSSSLPAHNIATGTSTPGEPADRIKDTDVPVDVQGVWRDWQGKTRIPRSDLANYAQACLPSTLIPIRIDVEIPPYLPLAPLGPPLGPTPGQHASVLAQQFDMTNPLNRQPSEATIPFRLKDTFLWNLHETLITTDQFAIGLTQDLDLPIRSNVAAEISKQIRTQLEEYAGVALHPLFHRGRVAAAPTQAAPAQQRDRDATPAGLAAQARSRADTPLRGTPRPSAAPPTTTATAPTSNGGTVTAVASAILPDADDYNPDDTYRCIVNLNINLSSRLYTDKFEWSLLHPPGTAEAFARQTCADLGLTGEWVPAMTHAIYEAVLRLKKEACESGGIVTADYFANDAAISGVGGEESSGAGWRYDPDTLGDAWEPKVEILSKEEIEKREGDRERQLRRLRRETARFSSSAGMAGGIPLAASAFGGFGFGGLVEEEERMGRGERTKKKRRFRSLSPVGRGTPGRATPDVAGGGYGGGGTLTDAERSSWRCAHCRVWGTAVWAVRDGPHGPRTLCNNCGYLYERDHKLPRWTKMLHVNDVILL